MIIHLYIGIYVDPLDLMQLTNGGNIRVLSNLSRKILWDFTIGTHIQLIKPSQVFIRPTGIQAVPSPVNSIIMTYKIFKLSSHMYD